MPRISVIPAELESALSALNDGLDVAALALDDAVAVAAGNASSAAHAYTDTDHSSMPGPQ